MDPALREEIEQLIEEKVAPLRVRREEHEQLVAAVRELQVALSHFENEMREALGRLAEAQARTEAAVKDLAAAQARTEQRVGALDSRVGKVEEALGELAQAQARSDRRMEELVAAGARADQRMEELAAAGARADQRMEELAAAQARTEAAMKDLAAAQARTADGFERFRVETRQQIGAMSELWGFSIEEVAAEVVPHYLRHEEGMEVGPLESRVYRVNGEELEVDLAGEGRRGEENLLVLCEAKSRAERGEVGQLAHTAERVAQATGRKVYPVLFPMRCSGAARERARELGILIVPWRYQYRVR